MIEIRLPRVADEVGCRTLAGTVIGEERAGAFIRSHLERHHLIVAEAEGEVVGFVAYRIDWFQCTFVSLVVVRDDFRRKGIAREFFKSVEAVSPTPRLYSSTEETNAVVHPDAPRARLSAERPHRQPAPGRPRAALLQAHPAPIPGINQLDGGSPPCRRRRPC